MAELILTWLLRINGAILLTAALTIALPVEWMATVHERLGLGPFPQGPIVVYLARSLSAMYAVHGAVTLFVGLWPRRYWAMIPLLAWLHVALGCVLLVTDLTTPMPAWWTAAEGIPIALFGILVFVLWKKSGVPAA